MHNSYDRLYHIGKTADCLGQQNIRGVKCFVPVYYVSDYLLEGGDIFLLPRAIKILNLTLVFFL